MIEIGEETKYKFDKYNWCSELYRTTSTDIGNFIKDDFFYWDLNGELDEHLIWKK